MIIIDKLVNTPFIISQTILMINRKYDKIIDNCIKRSNKYGIRNYGSLYILMHCYYYEKKYLESFEMFKELLKMQYLNFETKEWGVKLFVETEVANYHNYDLALKRCNQLIPIIDSKILINKIKQIQSYINTHNNYKI